MFVPTETMFVCVLNSDPIVPEAVGCCLQGFVRVPVEEGKELQRCRKIAICMPRASIHLVGCSIRFFCLNFNF